jgi:peroxiredoxin
MLEIGDPAPEFTLPSHLGKDVTLSDLRGKNVLLAFFPLAWTPV